MEAGCFREPLEAVRADLEQLLERSHQKVALHKGAELDPDWEAFQAAESIGRLRIFTARIAGELVGCCAFFMKRNAHYRSSLQAAQQLFVVAPEYRGDPIMAHLILFADRQLRDDGVQIVYHRASQLDIGPLLERLGYEVIDTEWGKRLENPSDESSRSS
jgi:GNAT superfamily N-acetyltransferase